MTRILTHFSKLSDRVEPGFLPNLLYIAFICLPAMCFAVVAAWVMWIGKAVVK